MKYKEGSDINVCRNSFYFIVKKDNNKNRRKKLWLICQKKVTSNWLKN